MNNSQSGQMDMQQKQSIPKRKTIQEQPIFQHPIDDPLQYLKKLYIEQRDNLVKLRKKLSNPRYTFHLS